MHDDSNICDTFISQIYVNNSEYIRIYEKTLYSHFYSGYYLDTSILYMDSKMQEETNKVINSIFETWIKTYTQSVTRDGSRHGDPRVEIQIVDPRLENKKIQ